MKTRIGLLIFCCIISFQLMGQINTTQFGFCYRPIFSSNYFRTGPKDFDDNKISYTLSQSSGYSTGALIRRGVTKKLTIESGILYVKRNYDLTLRDTTFNSQSDFSIIGYEIPILDDI